MRILWLVPWMKMGHGVAEVIACLDPYLRDEGWAASVGCLSTDNHHSHLDIHEVAADVSSVTALADSLGAGAVIAMGTPFFEVLPFMEERFVRVAYEAGDPTPDLFEADMEERRGIADNKRIAVYPHVDQVWAISSFIAHDIGWPEAQIIRHGVENIPDLGPKPLIPPRATEAALRVGSLTRLGAGEARYKGRDELLELHECLQRLGVNHRLELMGRGEAHDADYFRRRGVFVHLNGTEAERNTFLREIDVFVTMSLWEGTNLPLLEAQATGTASLALDTGAHPEFAPLLFSSVEDMAQQIARYTSDAELLQDHALLSYRFVRAKLSWAAAGRHIARSLAGAGPPRPPARHPTRRRSILRSIRYDGLRATVRKLHVDHLT